MLYLILKLLHIVSVTMFLGNITTGLFWKEHADRTRDPRTIAHALEGITGSDRWFTIPGVIGIVIAGIGTAQVGHLPLLHTGWILWSIVLFTISGIAFMSQVAPLQKRMAKLMRDGAASGTPDWAAYAKLSGAWALWGAVALLAPALALVFMVLKPALPSL
jgi:uncharacterized membrane protein